MCIECLDIKNSNNCFLSSQVEHSSYIYQSKNILYSQNISKSDIVKFSEYAHNCKNINTAILSKYCKNSSYIFGSALLTNCNNCLFCFNISDKSYMIFNQPVSEDEFKTYMRSLLSLWKRAKKDNYVKIDDSIFTKNKKPTINTNNLMSYLP